MLNFDGVVFCVGIVGIIAFTRWLCIWGEYHFTKRIWYVFLLLGIVCTVLSLFLEPVILAGAVSVLGFCFFWGIGEVIKQEERVRRGWFPANPKRAHTGRQPDGAAGAEADSAA